MTGNNRDTSIVEGDEVNVSSNISCETTYENCETEEQWAYLADEEWYFGRISREESKELLMCTENLSGTFLVRTNGLHGLVLSVKRSEGWHSYGVRHIDINRRTDNGHYYISSSRSCPTLQTLIAEYQMDKNGFLTHACPKQRPGMVDIGPELQQIPKSEVQLIKHLGRSLFSNVYCGKWKNGKTVAVKTFREDIISEELFLKQTANLRELQNNKIVSLFSVSGPTEPMYIVQEYMSKGNLLEFLSDERDHIEFMDLVAFATQISSAMDYLELNNVVHSNLAARNVLIDQNNVAKVCDIGLKRLLIRENEESITESEFLVKWTAPEALESNNYTVKSDVWSFGILLMELFTYGEVPYPGMSSTEVKEQVNAGYRMPKPENHFLPDDVYRFIRKCWHIEPIQRPTFDFLNHFFSCFPNTLEKLNIVDD